MADIKLFGSDGSETSTVANCLNTITRTEKLNTLGPQPLPLNTYHPHDSSITDCGLSSTDIIKTNVPYMPRSMHLITVAEANFHLSELNEKDKNDDGTDSAVHKIADMNGQDCLQI
jgi:hypothetical protein